MQTLKGRACVFAGATGGDGVEAVKALCALGMNVAMMTHNPGRAEALLGEIAALDLPGQCVTVQDGGDEVYRAIFERFGSLDAVVCNTGDNGDEDSLDDVDGEKLLRDLNHLVGGSYAMLKAALPYLRRSAAPRVVFTTTVEGVRGGRLEGFSNAVARGAVASLMKNCAARLAPEGICVNAVSKGAMMRVDPPRPEGHRRAKDIGEMTANTPMGRAGTPMDLAQALCFLLSEEAAFVTGTILDISGGLQLV